MAALPPAPSVLKIQLKWQVGQDVSCFNTYHVKFAGSGPSNADCNTLAGTVYQGVQAGQIISAHPTTVLQMTTVTDLTSPTAGTGVHQAAAPGTAGGGQLPANCCVLVNYVVQRRYRGGKARSYVPMGTDSDLADPQTWTGTAKTNFLNRMNTFQNSLLGLTWGGGNATQLVMVSYVGDHKWSQANPPDGPWKSHPVYRETPLIDQIVATAINSSVGTMRRRVRGKRT